MRRDGLTGTQHPRVLFKIDDVDDDMMVMRHQADTNGCRGKVVDGVCRKCGEATPGVHCFSFELVLMDLEDSDVFVSIMGADGIGASFFNGKSAGHVCGMSRAELDDVIDSWTEVPIIAKVAISVDPETDQIKMFPYQMRRLPMSYMP